MRILTWVNAICVKLPLGFLTTATLLFASLVLAVAGVNKHQQTLNRLWAKSMLWICRIEVRVHGLEQLVSAEQYIFVTNHASWLDIPVLITSLRQPLCFLAKAELFRIPFVGACLRISGQIPIARNSAASAVRSLREAARAVRDSGRSLVLFPEGTRSNNGLLEFKNGAAYLGIQTGICMVPAAVRGTDRLMPRGSAVIRSGVVHLGVGEPLPTVGLASTSRDKLTENLRRTIEDMMAAERAV